MDRLIYTSLNAIANLRDRQVTVAQNLSNQTVPGFRRDLPRDGRAGFLEQFEGLTSRAFQLDRGPAAFATMPGFLDQTGEPMDVAIPDDGYFYVRPENGAPALSRRGDLRIGADGALLNGAGDRMLDQSLNPVTIPPFRSMVIDDIGRITIEPLGGEPGQTVPVAMLASVVPAAGTALEKGLDGQIRTPEGTVPAPNQGARVMQGALERSNVNTTEELIAQIEIQRHFEVNLRMVKTAQEIDEAGSRLMRMPES